MAIVRKSHAKWTGKLMDGKGWFRSGGLEGQFDFHSRFEDGEGTNPEELIGAALAGCFSMALSAALEKAGAVPEEIDTTAEVFLDRLSDGFTIVKIILNTRVKVDSIDDESLRKIAEETKRTCPIGKALMAVPTIELNIQRI